MLGASVAGAVCGALRLHAGVAQGDPARALARSAAYLWQQQAEDGGWHSPQYGVMRSGQALTPYVLRALLTIPERISARPKGGVARAMEFMLARLDASGVLGNADPDIVEYPIYSTSYALRCAIEVKPQRPREMKMAKMARFLVGAQFQENNGFELSAAAYGGWGLDAPRKPGVSGHMDLAHTRRALEALAAFDAWSAERSFEYDRPAMESRAEAFLALVQKRPEAAGRQPPIFAEDAAGKITSTTPPFDGGFYFSPVVLAANKGRVEGEPSPHWRSYATATCDGILALLAAGVPREDERVRAAVAWLRRHTDVDYPQGVPTKHPEPWGEAIQFYHYSVRAEAYRALQFPADERQRLAAAVARHQRDDGSFVNAASPLMKEDDPVLCTAQATVALANCV
jgi:squalene-hopene/tetraprenyl-beta-curcumene cyclase